MKVLTGGLLIVVIINCSWFATAQTDPESEEIDQEAFRNHSISSEQVAQFIADIKSARRSSRTGGVTYDSALQTFKPVPSDIKCGGGPIRVLSEDIDPRTFFYPLPIVARCQGSCPANHWCLANRRRTRNRHAIEYRKFNLWGLFKFIPVGIRRLRLMDEIGCRCVPKCRPIYCFPPRNFNERTCQCECPRTVCKRPLVLDPSSCQCVCPRKTAYCRYGYRFSHSKCRCSRV